MYKIIYNFICISWFFFQKKTDIFLTCDSSGQCVLCTDYWTVVYSVPEVRCPYQRSNDGGVRRAGGRQVSSKLLWTATFYTLQPSRSLQLQPSNPPTLLKMTLPPPLSTTTHHTTAPPPPPHHTTPPPHPLHQRNHSLMLWERKKCYSHNSSSSSRTRDLHFSYVINGWECTTSALNQSFLYVLRGSCIFFM